MSFRSCCASVRTSSVSISSDSASRSRRESRCQTPDVDSTIDWRSACAFTISTGQAARFGAYFATYPNDEALSVDGPFIKRRLLSGTTPLFQQPKTDPGRVRLKDRDGKKKGCKRKQPPGEEGSDPKSNGDDGEMADGFDDERGTVSECA
ncbi:unnamed protein product [Vitrella brassicaformis CCMP3155]|uniref:Uncharacterized protein n=1 Tax=Vitrella brassicaformis (strain CCMP3155) TaxID=1169540 RepID=A0A0G4FU59_VITBC|nr:unnamed protein product [Vitrella brassicaformis CCMP3155]|eukprot:CEM18498.1 unnamed protein product [Vitrella brassicaformis CCMP3155]